MSRNRNKRKYNKAEQKVNIQEETLNNIIKIKRVCKPGDVNVNKVMYTIDSYREMMNKKIIPLVDKKLLSGEVFITKDNPYYLFTKERFETIDPENSYSNKIINVYDNYIEVEFKDESILNIIKSAIKEDESSVIAQMRYYGEFDKWDSGVKVYRITDIITFDIIVRK